MIAVCFALWLLATLDFAFSGYRAAAGRNGLIEKRDYYRRAMVGGALVGQIAAAIIGAAAFLLIQAKYIERDLIFAELENAGRMMLAVYIPYALLILATLIVRAIPSVDVRSMTSVLVFGPMTLLRPFVITAGILLAFAGIDHTSVLLFGALILILMLASSRILDEIGRL